MGDIKDITRRRLTGRRTQVFFFSQIETKKTTTIIQYRKLSVHKTKTENKGVGSLNTSFLEFTTFLPRKILLYFFSLVITGDY